MPHLRLVFVVALPCALLHASCAAEPPAQLSAELSCPLPTRVQRLEPLLLDRTRRVATSHVASHALHPQPYNQS